jgi:hypothetical protein
MPPDIVHRFACAVIAHSGVHVHLAELEKLQKKEVGLRVET